MKIKKVVIDGFRAYESAENGTFDFSLKNGECADFVAIFAPNGFGKTSFYDAVEYALTGNISRFVRDAYRNDYDSKSKTQLQRKKKQYVLRNHSIQDSATAKVTVTLDIDGEEKQKPREIPKPKTGTRDFQFKKSNVDPEYSGMPDVFLSQEAIDSFLREEKADARYTRFMANFGDSDESYRANLATLKRELDSTLQETRSTLEATRSVAELPIKNEIILEINDTIADLKTKSEIISDIDKSFNADVELSIRTLITKRSHELSQRRERQIDTIMALSELATLQTTFANAIDVKHVAQNSVRKNSTIRTDFDERMRRVRVIDNLRNAIADAYNQRALLLDLSAKMPIFDIVLNKKKEAVARKNAISISLNKINVDLSSAERRESECKRRIDITDTEVQKLLSSQINSTFTYSKIDSTELAIAEVELRLNQHRLIIEAINSRLKNTKEKIDSIRSLVIDENNADEPDLALISSDSFSPMQLRAAIIEKRAKQIVVTDAAKVLEATKSHSGQLSALLSLGQDLLSHAETSRCPLCTHDHGSYQALIDAIHNNKGVPGAEAAALQIKFEADSALNLASANVTDLIRLGLSEKAARLDELRESVQEDEQQLGEREVSKQAIETEMKTLLNESEILKSSVLRLPYQQFIERTTNEISALMKNREIEVADRSNCEDKILSYKNTQKYLQQEEQKQKTLLDEFNEDEIFKSVTEFCISRQIETESVREAISEFISGKNTEISTLNESADKESSIIEDIDQDNPSLASWSFEENAAVDARSRETILTCDSIIVPFLSRVRQYVPDYDETWTPPVIEIQIAKTFERMRIENDSINKLLETYELLDKQLIQVRPFIESFAAQEKLKHLEIQLFREEALAESLSKEYQNTSSQLNEKIKEFFYHDLINSIYRRIDPHADFKRVEFACDFEDDKPNLEVFVADKDGDLISPNLYFSAAQINILSLSIFLARALHAKNCNDDVKCILIDDPIHSMDSINVISTIDLLRSISLKFERQIILSTHDRNFFELLQRKLPPDQYKSKFLELETFGKVVAVEIPYEATKATTVQVMP
jgi:exonuclease SbcC